MFARNSFTPMHFNTEILFARVLEQLRSEQFEDQVQALNNDAAALARMTVALLQYLALDPNVGSRVEDFIPEAHPARRTNAGQVWVNLAFFQTANFIGAFTLESDSVELSLLVKAIQENLDSKMFKAAVLYRRLKSKFHPRVAAIRKRAQAAYQRALEASLARQNPQPVKGWVRPAAGMVERASEAGAHARELVYAPAREHLDRRMESVRKQTAHPDYAGSAYEIQTAFAVQHLLPAFSASGAIQ